MNEPTPEQTPPAAAEETTDASSEAEVALLRQQTAELKDQVLRALAEAENTRKRAQRDIEETRKYSISGLARELVNVFENLYRATETIAPESRQADPVLNQYAEGIDMTLRELIAVFERFGIKRVNPMGQPFDHNFHQAVVQIDDTDHAPGTVLQVMQAGYTIHDRLLRPAMVGVAKRPDGENPPLINTEA